MRRRALTTLFLALIGPGLAACATVSPVAPAASSATPSAVTPTAGATSATPSTTPATTPSATATATVTATGDDTTLVLRGDGLGAYAFGAKQADVTALLEQVLGEPDESSQGIRCSLDEGSPWAQTVNWGSFWVEYDAKDASKKSPRTLAAWGTSVGAPLPAPLTVQDGVPLTLTFSQLKAKYPTGKLEDLGLGDGSKRFVLPNKIFFVGAGNKPVNAQAGVFGICE